MTSTKRWALVFDDVETERAYRDVRQIDWRRFAIGTAVMFCCWMVSLAWVAIVMPASARDMAACVLCIIVPVFAGVLVVPRLAPARARKRIIGVLGPLSAFPQGLIPILLEVRAAAPFNPSFRALFAVALLSIHTFINARFVYKQLLTWSLAGLWMAIVFALKPVSYQDALDAAFWIGLAQVIGSYLSYAGERQSRRIFLQRRTIEDERARSESLLRNMLPTPIAERLKRGAATIADGHDSVTVLFADLVGFTSLSARMEPVEVVIMLNAIFTTFDELARSHGLEKIKTIGDAYMVVGGLPAPLANHARTVASMALAMRDALRRLDEGLAVRIGLHTGPVVAGVIGTSKYSYDLWGDTVNTASRMESHGAPGEIHLSQACRDALGDAFVAEERGAVEIKSKGPMRTFWLRGLAPSASAADSAPP